MASRVSTVDVFERDTPQFVESQTGRLPKYPLRTGARWGLRLLIAAFYSGLAVWWNAASGGDWSGTANAALADRMASLDWSTPGVGVIGQLYPPITSLGAAVVPGGAFGLAIAGSIGAAFTLQLILQSLLRKSFPVPVRVILVLVLATTPLYTYVVMTNFEATIGLMFFGLAMVDLVRFVTWANTQAGFRAGILFACAAFSDTTTVFAALVAALGGGLIIQSRQGARVANAVVVAFPTVTLFGSLAVLGIAFGAGPLAMVRGDLAWDPDRAVGFAESLATPLGWLYIAPLVVMVIASFGLGYPGTALISVLLMASTVLAFILGLTPPGVAGVTYVLLLLLAISIVPTPTDAGQSVLTAGVGVLLWILGWLTALQWPIVRSWMDTFGAVS
ncbi:hypothetical protein QL996_01240 [Planococcus sp. APC 4015]|nr:hypothetical protein [Planococcus sp. APC 4015]